MQTGARMRDRITFSRDQYGAPSAKTDTGHFNLLAGQLISDIINYAPDLLQLLDKIDRVRTGRSAAEEYEGNSSLFQATPDGVLVADLEDDGDSATYTFDEARAAILQYLDFLAPSAAQKQDAVTRWEAESGRTYPGRAELGLT